MDAKINIVVAMTHDHVIGHEGKLPWTIRRDLINFRDLTLGSAVIMGRKTYDSIVSRIGSSLPNRYNIVISQTMTAVPGIEICPSLKEAIELAAKYDSKNIFIIGGAQVFAQALPLADRLIISWIRKKYHGDTKFPSAGLKDGDWEVEYCEHFNEFDLNIYTRKNKNDQPAQQPC